jgi:hypothetical protein
VLFVADNADGAGAFDDYSDGIADGHLPLYYQREKVYLEVTHTKEEAQNAILAAINDGRFMINFIGHSSIQNWTAEKLLSVSTVSAMSNTDRYPFMTPFTCLEGSFHYPLFPSQDTTSLAEALVLADGKGAIASWSPTGLGVASGHDYLNVGIYDAIFADGVKETGMAVLQAKMHLFSSTNDYNDLLDTYALLGDPALQLAQHYPLYIPLVIQTPE